jgi:hypothetical protein
VAPPRTEAPAPQPETPAAAPEPPRQPIQEALPASELKRLQEQAENTRRGVRRLLDRAGRTGSNPEREALLERVRSFLQQSDEAETRGDMRQANELAVRAMVLVRELKP